MVDCLPKLEHSVSVSATTSRIGNGKERLELRYLRRVTQLDARTNRHWARTVTETIPIEGFGAWADLAPTRGDPFITDVEVLSTPELDDLNDLVDESPWVLAPPSSPIRVPGPARRRDDVSVAGAPAVGNTSVDGGGVTVRQLATPMRGRHRPPAHRQNPRATGATQSRLLIAAIAAGAIAAGTNAAVHTSQARANSERAADTSPSQDEMAGGGLQIVSVASTSDSATHRQELSNGTAFAQERAQREARLLRPQFVFPAMGIVTSGFGARWGTLHGGLDIANAIGTPIYAASDGEVIASGPTTGYGMWVKIRAADGTVTLYGHIDTAIVQVGERVMAGDQIATMGNRGNSTGPHLHFEVHLDESQKTDPIAWLRERGVSDG